MEKNQSNWELSPWKSNQMEYHHEDHTKFGKISSSRPVWIGQFIN